MKWFIASDIHGSAFWCKKMIEAFEKEKADRILLLGDLLYHGPRNDLPKDYDPRTVIEMLNSYSDKIFAVRGNCDSEVDEMVLNFPILADYTVVCDNGKAIFATHGHIYSDKNLPSLKNGEVLMCGHTHVAKNEEHDGFVYMNPGSVSIPKENTGHGYIIFDENGFKRKELV